MRIAVYPGSFDPITNGHLDIIERASRIFDIVIVGVLNNSSKNPLFTASERVMLIEKVTDKLENVKVECFDGLLVDFASQHNANVIIKGLRTVNDFEYEFVTDNKLDGPIRLLRYKGDALNLVIPADIDGHLVNSIAPGAFSSVPLRSIVINGNTLLESEAFRDCRKLETVVLHNVEVIESYAFASCTNLKSISLCENLKTIGKYSFNACRSLENVIIPSGVESIDKYAFRECSSLRYLEIPDTIQYIGEGIIQATELQTLVTPYIGSSSEEIMTIGYFFGHGSRFNDSVVLSNITFKQQTFIPDNTFYGCS